VTLTWTASSYAEGGAPAGYVVRRFEAASGVEQIVVASCSSVINALTCTENSVAKGCCQYTITPATANWRGPQSVRSLTIVV